MKIDLIRVGRTQGTLLALGPSLAIGTYRLTQMGEPFGPAAPAYPLFWILGCAGLFLSGALFTWFPGRAKVLGTAAVAALSSTFITAFLASPTLALFSLILGTTLLYLIWTTRSVSFRSERSKSVFQRTVLAHTLRTVCMISVVSWFGTLAFEFESTPVTSLSVITLIALTASLAWRWFLLDRRINPKWMKVLGAATLLLTIACILLWSHPGALITSTILLPIALLILVRDQREETFLRVFAGLILEHPARLLVFTFATISMIGSMMLYLPVSTTIEHGITFLDAVFTAVSAVCVTGLTVIDPGRGFTSFGQVTILCLIQIGALGIMTFYTAAFTILGRRLSIRHELALTNVIGSENPAELAAAIRKILVVTFGAEVIGTLVLATQFHRLGESVPEALWQGLFTAVAAFANAGFGLQAESLMPYSDQPMILHTVALLVIIGGVSPLIVTGIPKFIARRQMDLHARLVLWTTGILLVGGTFAFLTFEWTNTLSELPFFDRFHNAWFQSVTARTAGFNSLEMTALKPVTLVLMMTLMLIGGSPGGTAGGMKTTTFALLVLAVISAFRGQSQVTIFGRRIPHANIYRSAAILSSSVFMLLITLIALLLTQDMAPSKAIFETVSALATVGLTIGGTAELDQVGKIIIVICMFTGRVGPLTVFMFLSSHEHGRMQWKVPEEEVTVG